MSQAIFMTCCAVLFVVPLIFVANKVYQDGVVGRLGLCGISFTSATFLLEWGFSDVEYEMLGQTTALVASFTVFLCWHLFRFHSRVLRSKRAECGELERRRDCTGMHR